MWCEEINDKYRELAQDSPWWFHPTGDDTITREKTSSQDQRVPGQISTARQLDLTLQLLNAFYKNPDDFSGGEHETGVDCHWAAPWFHPVFSPVVRAWMIQNIAGSQVFVGYLQRNVLPSLFVGPLASLAIKVLFNPDGPGSALTDAGQHVVSALCDVILRTNAIDTSVWSLLWIWAAGGTTGKALIRTRSHALQAISAIARRSPQLVGTSTIALIERLAQSVDGIKPPASYSEEQERQLFAYTANSAAGDVAAAMVQQAIAVPPGLTNPNTFLPPGTRPASFWNSLPRWAPIVGGAGLMSMILGAVILWRGRTTSSRRQLPA